MPKILFLLGYREEDFFVSTLLNIFEM